jgi:predicted SprT family Zn-dependent metalloprotease
MEINLMFDPTMVADDDIKAITRQFNVIQWASDLMLQHGLIDWTFQLDRAKRRAGRCSPRRKVISMSSYYVIHNSDEELRDTMLHEIAHALAGCENGHNHIWKAKCIEIGAKPERCFDGTKVKMPKGCYEAICGKCNAKYHKHRKVKRRYVCPKCGPKDGMLVFVKNDLTR